MLKQKLFSFITNLLPQVSTSKVLFLQGLGKKSVEPKFLFRFASTALFFQTEEYFFILISSPGLECLLVIPLNRFQFSVCSPLPNSAHAHTHKHAYGSKHKIFKYL